MTHGGHSNPATIRPNGKANKSALTGPTSLHALLVAAMAGSGLMTTARAAQADDDTAKLRQLEAKILQIQRQNQAEIAELQHEVRQIKEAQRQPAPVVATASNQVVYAQPAAAPTTSNNGRSSPFAPKLIESPTHQFGLSSANGANTLSIIARFQFDGADYLHIAPQGGIARGAGPGSTSGGPLDSGINARRARLGIAGTFQNDFAYRFIYDFGGSSDSQTAGVSGASTSGIENGYITYNGFYHPEYRVPVALDLGYLDVPWTLDEATSSNDIMFLERASSQVIATEFGGGDFRSAFGGRSNNRRYWVGAYLTGPISGAPHTGAPGPSASVLLRASYRLLQTPKANLHIGGDFGHLFQARSAYNGATTGLKTNSPYLVLSDRPELRVDPTNVLNTGGIPTSNANVMGAETAGNWGPLYVQGEYFRYAIAQFAGGTNPTDGLANLASPTLNFDGGYVEGSYSLGGTRQYIPATGAYSGVIPVEPFDLRTGGWGALELAARYSTVNLNDGLRAGIAPHLTGGVNGGDQQSYDVGLNWYPNINMKFMVDYSHVSVNKRKPTTMGAVPIIPDGAGIDAVALRAQFTY